MNSQLLSLYHRLPASARTVAASLQGYYLRWWRYGPDTERLVEEALERDAWSAEQWEHWQEEQLGRLLHRAATKVPYYRRQWNERRRRGDGASWDVLDNWPVLQKDELREHPEAFVADDCHTRWMRKRQTSGTTGTPIRTYVTRRTLRRLYAIQEARLRRWNGVSIRERWAIMGGQMVVPFDQQEPPFWVRNAGLNQLYLSTHHLSRKNAPSYAEALRRFAPTHLVVYPSSAHVLATYLLEQSLDVPAPRVIISNAEQLFEGQRKKIQEAFGCPVRNTYSMNEAVLWSGECEQDTLHLSPEVGALEVLDDHDDTRVGHREAGRFVATSLMNADMPLVRYEVGDRGKTRSNGQCACGRSLPALAEVAGRANDLILTPDGRRVFWINPVFYGLPIQESQVIQESRQRLRVVVVPTAAYTPEHTDTIQRRMRERVGALHVDVEEVEHIARTEAGKLRGVVSKVA